MDKEYMRLAIELAKKGTGHVSPNPLVGAVIVKQGKIIGQGFHEQYGEAHAEVNAINEAIEDVKGATIYVTLEPCSHQGKTPPCAKKIIKHQLAKVVIGMLDPNPLVSGSGVKLLQDAGIEVEIGILEKECQKLNEVFIKYIVHKTPFVVMKSAMSLDGKIATSSGESKYITSEDARTKVHELRHQLSAIMVGVNTIIMDDPLLTCRLANGKNPIRIIVDSKLRIPLSCNVIVCGGDIKTIIATTQMANADKILALTQLGITVLTLKSRNGRVDLQDLMIKLGELNIDSLLLEGGSTLNYAALESGIVDKVQCYIAPKIIGGDLSKTPVGGNGIQVLSEAFKVDDLSATFIGADLLLEGYIRRED